MTSDRTGQWLYRILSFDRLVQIFRTNAWYFAHPSLWEDPYERRHSSPLDHRLRAQCWCRNGVSDAMWRIYSPDKHGVRIRVNARKLNSALKHASKTQGFHFRLNKVKYLNQIEELAYLPSRPSTQIESIQSFKAASDYLFRKRMAFSHEDETRIVLLAPPHVNKTTSFSVNMNATDLIESVLVDPRAPDAFVDAYTSLLHGEFAPALRIQKSALYAEAQKREA